MSKYDNMTGAQLVAEYNKAAKKLGEKPVKKFANKVTAIKRTEAIVAKASGGNKRSQPINWPKRTERHNVREEVSAGIKSLGARFVQAMQGEGATQAKLESIVAQYDADTGQDIGEIPSRVRATMRMLHTYNGFGVRQNGNRFKLVG